MLKIVDYLINNLMDFRLWFEMELSKVIPPREFSKKIWVNQPNNQQQIDYWQRKNTKRVYPVFAA